MKYVALFSIAAMLAGCAKNASEITPVTVPPSKYAGMSCQQLLKERSSIVEDVNVQAASQNKAAENDKGVAAVGAILFWPALFALSGGGNEEALAIAKGNYDAIVLQGKKQGCWTE